MVKIPEFKPNHQSDALLVWTENPMGGITKTPPKSTHIFPAINESQ